MKRCTSLNLLYPPFAEKLKAGLKDVRAAGIPMQLFETFRSRDRQNHLYAKGRTKPGARVTKAKAGRSYHQYGIAADIVLWIDGRWSWEETHLYREAGKIMEKQGLTWLGRTSGDLVHYQLKIPCDIDDLEQIYNVSGYEGVWMYLDSIV